MTGRGQAVLLHAGVGLLHGAMGILTAQQGEVPMVVMSGKSVSLGENPDMPIEPQWYGGLSVGGPERLIEPLVKHARQIASPFTIHDSIIRAGEMAERGAARAGLSQHFARRHAAWLDAAARCAPRAAAAQSQRRIPTRSPRSPR